MKNKLFRIFYRIRLTRVVMWWNRKGVMILCYHGVTAYPERRPDDPMGLHTRQQRFVQHLDYLKRHYNVISLSDYLG